VVCPDLINLQNIGSIIRIAAAFGADAVVLGEQCIDPFYRLSIRVSMGTIFNIPIVRSRDLLRDLVRLRGEFGYQLAATVLDTTAEPLRTATRPGKFAILFGGEGDGLGRAYIEAADRRVTIPMQRGTDSLNVAAAAAVFMFHFCG
jgi:tRNA G18 (ribose-2'-O)-methylase SpoU